MEDGIVKRTCHITNHYYHLQNDTLERKCYQANKNIKN